MFLLPSKAQPFLSFRVFNLNLSEDPNSGRKKPDVSGFESQAAKSHRRPPLGFLRTIEREDLRKEVESLQLRVQATARAVSGSFQAFCKPPVWRCMVLLVNLQILLQIYIFVYMHTYIHTYIYIYIYIYVTSVFVSPRKEALHSHMDLRGVQGVGWAPFGQFPFGLIRKETPGPRAAGRLGWAWT